MDVSLHNVPKQDLCVTMWGVNPPYDIHNTLNVSRALKLENKNTYLLFGAKVIGYTELNIQFHLLKVCNKNVDKDLRNETITDINL